jgi:hypothetical protein
MSERPRPTGTDEEILQHHEWSKNEMNRAYKAWQRAEARIGAAQKEAKACLNALNRAMQKFNDYSLEAEVRKLLGFATDNPNPDL